MKQADVAFTRDIILETAKRLKMPTRKVEIVVEIIVQYIHYIANLTDFASILLPKVGVLHLKETDCKKNLRKYGTKSAENDVDAEDRYHAHNNKLVDIHEHIYLRRNKGKSLGSRHGVRRRINNGFYTVGKKIREIEEIQNKVYEENIQD